MSMATTNRSAGQSPTSANSTDEAAGGDCSAETVNAASISAGHDNKAM
jgi:hypothetical protein